MLNILLSSLVVSTLAFSCAPVMAAGTGYAPQISDKQSIKITVTPRSILEPAADWAFEVTVESHTQDLGDDLAKSAMLIADGKQYRPLAWEGAPPGGHHRKGLLRFKTIAPRPSSIELQMRLAGDATPRIFKWPLK